MRARITKQLIDAVYSPEMDNESYKHQLRSLAAENMIITQSEPLDLITDSGIKALLMAIDTIFRRFDQIEAPLLRKMQLNPQEAQLANQRRPANVNERRNTRDTTSPKGTSCLFRALIQDPPRPRGLEFLL